MRVDTYTVPHRATHAREARTRIIAELAAPPDVLEHPAIEAGVCALVEAEVARRAPERHAARVAAARADCATAAALHCPGLPVSIATPLVARLALHGQGGRCDRGGEHGSSALPLLPASRRWRRRAWIGGAWCAALEAVAAEEVALSLLLLDDGGWVLRVECGGTIHAIAADYALPQPASAECHLALARQCELHLCSVAAERAAATVDSPEYVVRTQVPLVGVAADAARLGIARELRARAAGGAQ